MWLISRLEIDSDQTFLGRKVRSTLYRHEVSLKDLYVGGKFTVRIFLFMLVDVYTASRRRNHNKSCVRRALERELTRLMV